MVPARLIRLLLALSFSAGAVASTPAQCLDWRAVPDTRMQTIGGVTAATTFDAGFGPNLFIAGNLRSPQPPYVARALLRWDGTAFHDVPGGLGGTVDDLFSYDDGSGLVLYAIGTLSINTVGVGGIARWNGATWSVPGGGIVGSVSAWTSFDDGTGMGLYVGGQFYLQQGAPGDRVSRWNGSTWSALPTIPGGNYVKALDALDDGSGRKLFIGLSSWVGNGFHGLCRLDATGWTNLTPSSSAHVQSLRAFDDGSGPALFVSGGFIGSSSLMRWNGASLQPVTTVGLGGVPYRLTVLDTGTGPSLHAHVANASFPIAVWNGSVWTGIPGVPGPFSGYPTSIGVATVLDSGFGPKLVGASGVQHAFGYGCSIATWTGTAWDPFQQHIGFTGEVRCLENLDLGSGPQLCAGGGFVGAGIASTNGIAIWNGKDWTRIAQAVPGGGVTTALETLRAGTTTYLCATRIGASFAAYPMSGGTAQIIGTGSGSDQMLALQEFGGHIYIGGIFTHLGGPTGVPTPNLGRWDGSSIGGMGAGMNGAVNALTTFDDGSGLALYAAGTFTTANGVAANRIARWNGSTWSPLGSGVNDLCDTLVAFDDGSGPALYAAGTFTIAGGVPAERVAKWQNGTWSALGAGLNAQVLKLAAFDDGSGPTLYAGGNFTASGSTSIDRIARWNGVSWTGVGAGVDSTVWAMQSFDNGSGAGPELLVGGSFHNASNQNSDSFAAWRGCSGPISRYCFGDGTVAPCPCGNQGLAARGCDNSLATGGARMNASGTSNPDTIEFYLAGLIPGTAAMLFQGESALSAPLGLGDGLLCAGGNIRRLEVAFSSGGTLAFPTSSASSISAQSAAAGDPLLPGNVRGYQAWYRDSGPAFCTSATSNVSNAVRIVW